MSYSNDQWIIELVNSASLESTKPRTIVNSLDVSPSLPPLTTWDFRAALKFSTRVEAEEISKTLLGVLGHIWIPVPIKVQ